MTNGANWNTDCETIIIGVSGYKQSGKTSLCNYLQVYDKVSDKRPSYYGYDVARLTQTDDGEVLYKGNVCFNLVGSAAEVKIYSFADPLKEFCVNVLGLLPEQCHGSDAQKNSFTKYKWDNLSLEWREKFSKEKRQSQTYSINGREVESRSLIVPKSGFMTGREILQIFGTNVCRNMFCDTIWVDATMAKIRRDKPRIALIADVRFKSEVESIMKYENGYVIRLLKRIDASDRHPSETELDNYDWNALGNRVKVIDNRDLSIMQKNEIAVEFFDKIKESKL